MARFVPRPALKPAHWMPARAGMTERGRAALCLAPWHDGGGSAERRLPCHQPMPIVPRHAREGGHPGAARRCGPFHWRHAREGGHPDQAWRGVATAGRRHVRRYTKRCRRPSRPWPAHWMPACAGMTERGRVALSLVPRHDGGGSAERRLPCHQPMPIVPRHAREGGHPDQAWRGVATAGRHHVRRYTTRCRRPSRPWPAYWMPACAGMTERGRVALCLVPRHDGGVRALCLAPRHDGGGSAERRLPCHQPMPIVPRHAREGGHPGDARRGGPFHRRHAREGGHPDQAWRGVAIAGRHHVRRYTTRCRRPSRPWPAYWMPARAGMTERGRALFLEYGQEAGMRETR
jgi:ribosomal protein L34E